MLKPRTSSIDTAALQPFAAELPTFSTANADTASAAEVLEHVQQVRTAHQRLADLARDTDAQAARYLVNQHFKQHTDCLRSLLQLYYPFSPQLLADHAERLDQRLLAQNIHVISMPGRMAQVPDLKPDWVAISRYYPLTPALLKRFSQEIDWEEAASNPLIDWSENLIRQHNISDSDFFNNLSTNPGPNWTPSLIQTFLDKWNGARAGLMSNENLPWDDGEVISAIREITEKKKIDWQEVYSARDRMQNRDWERRSLNRHLACTLEDLRENADELHWARLSANPALPFSLELLAEFAERWHWDELSTNPGLYEKVIRPWLSDSLVHELLLLTA